MRRALSVGVGVLLLFVAGCASSPAPTPSPAPVAEEVFSGTCALEELHQFYDYPYPQLVAQVAELGRLYLEMELRQGVEGRPAMVLDIDETAVTNWGHMEKKLCAPVSEFDEYAALGVSPALESILDLYRWAREQGIAVFFVTGRREWLREATERNLREVGFTEYERVFLRPAEAQGSWNNYKAEARRQVTEEGYEVLLNLGDQLADLEGGYTRHSLLIPNPFYVITPRDFGRGDPKEDG